MVSKGNYHQMAEPFRLVKNINYPDIKPTFHIYIYIYISLWIQVPSLVKYYNLPRLIMGMVISLLVGTGCPWDG